MLKPGVTLYYVRHGQTEWNRERRYQGQRDIPLNETGRAQAARNGRILAETLGSNAAAFDYIASPLARATETMQIVRRELGLPPDDYHTDDRLREINYGHWEGLQWEGLAEVDPAGFAAREADFWGWQPEGGESYRMLGARVGSWLADVTRDSVVVAHGGVSRALRGLLFGVPAAEIPNLPVPQDQVLVVEAGAMRWL